MKEERKRQNQSDKLLCYSSLIPTLNLLFAVVVTKKKPAAVLKFQAAYHTAHIPSISFSISKPGTDYLIENHIKLMQPFSSVLKLCLFLGCQSTNK